MKDCRLKTKSSTAIQLNLFKQKQFEKKQLSDLRVWYGFTHLTKKVMKKRALQILFENDYHCRNEEKVNRWMHIATVRQQTVEEAKDGKQSNRMFTSYSLFIDDKRFKGNINAVLEANSEADKNNVSEDERKEISNKLLEKYIELKNINKL